MMPVTMARAGEKNYIKRISGKDEIRAHLATLGFVAGEAVTVVNTLGGNVILSIKDTRVALDRELAQRILI